MHYIDELETEDLKGKKILLRLDLNVPVKDGQVADDFDIQKIIPTIDFLREYDAQTIIISHIENAKFEPTSLLPVFDCLKGYFPVEFCPTYFTPEAIDKLLKLENKGVLLFENVRNNLGEVSNDQGFAKKLSQMADIFVNDAFGVSHRKHASIVGIPQFLPHYGGLLMQQEIKCLSRVFNPARPFVFILGGSKFETKIPLIKKYLEKADKVFVAGAIANDIFKARGFEVGTSLISNSAFDNSILQNPKLVTPVDVTVTKPETLGVGGLSAQAGEATRHPSVEFKKSDKVQSNEYIVDVGPKTLGQLRELLKNAKTVVWNGPLGNYEAGFGDKTEQLAKILASLGAGKEDSLGVGSTLNSPSADSAEVIIGGGDTLASINKLNLTNLFSFVSTGGGAMLQFLLDETLVGIEALEK